MTLTPKPKEEQLISMNITVREMQIINVMRRKPFGTYVIKKYGGVLVRIEPRESILLKDDPTADVTGADESIDLGDET